MVVKRRGAEQPTVPRAMRPLGRVLVTIDDLHALLSLIVQLDRDISHRDNVVVNPSASMEFDGGDFTEPEDLRKLSDEELKRIVVKSSNIEVVLGPEKAMAIGDPMAAAEIYNRWARARQVRIRPKRRSWDSWILFFFGIAFGLSLIGLAWMSGVSDASTQLVWTFVGSFLIIITLSVMRSMPRNFAVVRAVSLDEFRKGRDVRNRHWMTAAIALAGVAVALIGVLVTVLLKK